MRKMLVLTIIFVCVFHLGSATILDDFEAGGISSNYTGPVSDYSTNQDNPYSGSYSLESSGNNKFIQDTTATSSINPSKKGTISSRIYVNGKGNIDLLGAGFTNGSNYGYIAVLDTASPEYEIYEYEDNGNGFQAVAKRHLRNPVSLTNGNSYKLSLQKDGDTYTVSLEGNGNTYSDSITDSTVDNIDRYGVLTYDGSGGDMDYVTYNLSNSAPVINSNSSAPKYWVQGSEINLSVNASDSNGNLGGVNVSISNRSNTFVSNKPMRNVSASNIFQLNNSFVPSDSFSWYNLTYTAYDSAGATDTLTEKQYFGADSFGSHSVRLINNYRVVSRFRNDGVNVSTYNSSGHNLCNAVIGNSSVNNKEKLVVDLSNASELTVNYDGESFVCSDFTKTDVWRVDLGVEGSVTQFDDVGYTGRFRNVSTSVFVPFESNTSRTIFNVIVISMVLLLVFWLVVGIFD